MAYFKIILPLLVCPLAGTILAKILTMDWNCILKNELEILSFIVCKI